MSIASELKYESVNEEERELNSLKKHIDSIVKDIPDKWNLNDKSKHSENIEIDFSWATDEIAKILKYWCWRILYRDRFEANTARSMIYCAKYFLDYAKTNYGIQYINEDYEEAWSKYIEYLSNRVRSNILNEEEKNKFSLSYTIELKQIELQPRTAYQYASNALLFLGNLASIYSNFEWVNRVSINGVLPHHLAKYFSSKERYELKNKLIRLQFENKTKVIPYDELLEIMEGIQNWKHIQLQTAIILAMHTGLRISEIRYLKVDCIHPVSKEEIDQATMYRQKRNIGLGGVVPDWSESYWIKGHKVIKQKKTLEWYEGTPIMVSKIVYDAINRLAESTQELRKESGSKHLFLSKSIKQGRKSIGVTSYSALQNSKQRLVKSKSLPYFKFHQFRATFATMLYDLDIPEEMIQKYLNHVSVDMTSGYIASKQERDYLDLKAVAAGRMLGVKHDSEKIKSFIEEVRSIVNTNEWDRLNYYDHLAVFESIKKRHNITMIYYDHGFCLLPMEEECPHGFADTKPCYLAGCNDYEPDLDEMPAFVDMLQEREKVLIDIKQKYEKQCACYPESKNILEQRFEDFNKDTAKILNIVDYLRKQSVSGEE